MSSNSELQSNKLALVTGGAKRIGAGICRYLHDKNYDIVCTYRHSRDQAHRLVDELNRKRSNSAQALRLDLGEQSSIDAVAEFIRESYSRLDILVNNASEYFPLKFGRIKPQDWDKLFIPNAYGPLFLSQSLHDNLKRCQGSIVNIIDSNIDRGIADFTVYTMAKSALAAMTRSLAVELAPEIRVNGVSPGSILWTEKERVNPKYQTAVLSRCCLQRTGTPEEIAEAVWWLGEKATYTTGVILPIDGGLFIHR